MKYIVHRYYGGDYPDDTVIINNIDELEEAIKGAEHYELVS